MRADLRLAAAEAPILFQYKRILFRCTRVLLQYKKGRASIPTGRISIRVLIQSIIVLFLYQVGIAVRADLRLAADEAPKGLCQCGQLI